MPRAASEMAVPPDPPDKQTLARTSRALASGTLCRCFQVIAGGNGTPSRIAQVLEKTKHATSLQLARLRDAGLIEQAPHPSGDGRRKRYVVAWDRFGEIFAQDHALELTLFRDGLLSPEDHPSPPPHGPATLAVTGTGRLILHRSRRADPQPPAKRLAQANDQVRQAVWGFTQLLRVYLAKRSHPTLRAYLQGAYQELVREAEQLDQTTALGRFMAFQASVLDRPQPVATMLDEAIAQAPTPPPAPREPDTLEPPKDRRVGRQVGRQTTDGAFVLRDDVQAVMGPDVELVVLPSFLRGTHPGSRPNA